MSSTSSGFGSTYGQSASVEFTCSTCGRKLQVTRDAIGRKAQCPQCSTVQTVPDPSIATAIVSPTASSFGNAHAAATNNSGISFSSPPPPSAPASPPLSLSLGALANDTGFVNPPARAPSESQLNTFQTSPLNYGTSKANSATRELFQRIQREIHKLFVGQDELVLGTLVALFSGGHVLIESVPGLGKTLFVRTLGRVLGCNFGRIQFTADLMPSDITGAPIFNIKTQEFDFRPGPVFTQILLADEINRSPAKTHAALLEIMQEYRVTVDGTSHTLQRPFLVMATQNPIESEGTYNLPEAQLDRFMFKLVANYPAEREEAEILRMHSQEVDINRRLDEEVSTVTSPEEILRISQENAKVHVDEKLIDYINKLVRMTRNLGQFHMGASPRAGLSLMRGARTLAAFEGRDYAVPDDVVHIALPTLRHRVILTAEAEVEGHKVDDVLTQMIRSVEVPRL